MNSNHFMDSYLFIAYSNFSFCGFVEMEVFSNLHNYFITLFCTIWGQFYGTKRRNLNEILHLLATLNISSHIDHAFTQLQNCARFLFLRGLILWIIYMIAPDSVHSSRGIVFLKIFPFLFLFCKIIPDTKYFVMRNIQNN